MTMQTIILVIWIFLNLISLISPLRKNLAKQPTLNKSRTVAVIFLEGLAVILSFVKENVIENKYFLVSGTLFLIFGWIISNNRLLAPPHGRTWLIRLRDRVFSLIGIHKDFYYLSLSGDWLQFIGLSFVLSSFYGLIFSIILFPIVIHFITISLMPPKTHTGDPHIIQPTKSFVWPGWGIVTRVIITNIIILLFFC